MRIVRVIDRGGFGRVEEIDFNDGSKGARKVFDPSPDVLNSSPLEKLQARFRREVTAQSLLSSEFAIPILTHDLSGEEMWYTMPLCDRNFQTQIQEDRAAGVIPREALAQIINALEQLHAIGLKHRDLNPRNILLHEGRWKLADFGLVSPLPNSASNVSSSLAAWGTFPYMAPEQSLDFKHVGVAADIYAFGCILHDIFTDGQRVPLARHTCDGPIGMVIERCTEIDPERRFKDVTAVRGALFTILAEPLSLEPSLEATEWAARLSSSYDEWDAGRLRHFARYVCSIDDATDLWNVFVGMDEEAIERFYEIDLGYADSVSIAYCDWVMKTTFDYEMCDVVVQRLLAVLAAGSIDVKARSILAIARLGKSRHRFYVMRKLVRVCSPDMDDALASRIAFEIRAEDAYWNFVDSAVGIDLTTAAFHPAIASVLNERINRYRKQAENDGEDW